MRTLKYAILGMLSCGEMSGYALSREFQSTLNEFWSAAHSQIYPELKKLYEEGLVSFDVAISGNVLEKKIYRLTEKGQEAFMEWLSEDEPMQPTPRDVFRLRVFFSDRLTKEKQRELLETHLKQHRERLMHLREKGKKFEDEENRTADVSKRREEKTLGDYMVLRGAVLREESNCRWLEECIRLNETAAEN